MIKIFGCSFSADYTSLTHWSTIMKNHMNETEVLNFARVGQTNEHIMFSIIEQLDKFEKDDVVIINTSGQGRMSIGPNSKYVWFPSKEDVLNLRTGRGTKKLGLDLITKWNEQYYMPNIIDSDPFIDSIIHLANEIDSKVLKVILWNLSSLNSYTPTSYNDGIESSPKIPYTDLWAPTSQNGSIGYANYFHENEMGISMNDPHPNQGGHLFLAQEFLNEMGYQVDLKSQNLI